MTDEPNKPTEPEDPPEDAQKADGEAAGDKTPETTEERAASESRQDEAPVAGEGSDEAAAEPEEDAEAKAAAEAEAKAKAEAAAKAKAEAAAKAKAAKEAAEAAKPPWEKLPVAPTDEDASGDPLVELLRSAHGEAIEEAFVCGGDLRVQVSRGQIATVCQQLNNELGYRLIEDLCGVHYPAREGAEFEVVYHFFNIREGRRLRLKVVAAEGESVPTIATIYLGANWMEREAYDMYGIRFDGHPDMTRILLWEGFNGYPLRKDFPVEGIDTGSAIYPEYYEESAGPVVGTGTGWKPQPPPEPEPEPAEEGEG
jgi:NADH-quinone oxidoreductase subunit C